MAVKDTNDHKFQQDSGMSFAEVYGFAFGNLIPLMRNLASELEREDFIELLQKVASDTGAAGGSELAESLTSNDFETWTSTLRVPNRFWEHVLTTEIVEDTETAFEVKTTECLWAKTFREAGAPDIGYATICHPDYAFCQGFNPKIRMVRSKTLMQGDACCNHRWVVDA
jgi:hypothetical protein